MASECRKYKLLLLLLVISNFNENEKYYRENKLKVTYLQICASQSSKVANIKINYKS